MLVWSILTGEDALEHNELNLNAGALAAAGLEVFLYDFYHSNNDNGKCVVGGGGFVKSSRPKLVLAASMGMNEELIGDQQPFFGHFMPGGLGLIATKVTIVSLSARLRSVQKRIEEIEDEDAEAIMQIELADVLAPSRHKHELSIWKGFGRNLRIGVIRDLSIITVQRIYELLTIKFVASEKNAKSLVKNIPKSSVRKAERYQNAGVLTLMQKVQRSAFKGQMMFWLALFTVNQAIDTWVTYRSPKPSTAVGFDRNETYMKRLVQNALRCAGGCVLAAFGAAIGAAIKPGLGTTLGMNIAPQFVYLIV